MSHPFRTRFKKEIIAEFMLPARRKRREQVIILSDGMPSVPSKHGLMNFLSKKGFWVIHFRYRGSWESDGSFLKISPEKDILDIIDQLPRGFMSLWDHTPHRITPDKIFIIAPSFGGPAGILASRDPRINKVVCISPVIDWRAPSKTEPLGTLSRIVHDAFGNGYRGEKNAWKKLVRGNFYNPIRHLREIDGSKLLIFHARNDATVRAKEVVAFARRTGATLKLYKKGGHLSTARTIEKNWKLISRFFGM